MSALLDALAAFGAVLDTPGSIARNSLMNLSGTPTNPFQGLFDPEDRTRGRELTDAFGLTDEANDPDKWFESGDIAGFGAELLTDPLNIFGGAGILKNALSRRGAKAANRTTDFVNDSAIREAGESFANYADDVADQNTRMLSDGPPAVSIRTDPQELSPGGMYDPTVARAMSGGKEVGMVDLMGVGPMERNAAESLFHERMPGVFDDATVARVSGSNLDKGFRGRGVGQQMYVDAMDKSPAEWFYNSGNSDDATRAIEAMKRKGLAEVNWHRQQGGPRVMRLTDKGREAAGTNTLIDAFSASKPSPKAKNLDDVIDVAQGFQDVPPYFRSADKDELKKLMGLDIGSKEYKSVAKDFVERYGESGENAMRMFGESFKGVAPPTLQSPRWIPPALEELENVPGVPSKLIASLLAYNTAKPEWQ